jgi:hypothetical protein
MDAARIDVAARWQDSSVTDPVTGAKRVLTANVDDDPEDSILDNDNEYVLITDFRQDFEEARTAWGVEMRLQGEQPIFKVNELDVREEGAQLNVFIETTRWFDIKLRLEFNNLLDPPEQRERSIYSGLRGLSPIERILREEEKDGRELVLLVSGSF